MLCVCSHLAQTNYIYHSDAFNNSSDGDSSFWVGSSLWRMTQQSMSNRWDPEWFCYFSKKHGEGTKTDCCKCSGRDVRGLTKKIGGLPVPSGYYCFNHWRQVVSATWTCQELCDCMLCSQALLNEEIPGPPSTKQPPGNTSSVVPPPPPPGASAASPADESSTFGSSSRLWPSGTHWCYCDRVEGPMVLEGRNFKEGEYTVWEAFDSPEQVAQEPYLFVWLHGADGGGYLPTDTMSTMQRHLQRRTFFLLPRSPRCCDWGVSYTKKQNKNGLGWVYGKLNTEYLSLICGVVHRISITIKAIRVLVAGYSMGGYGAYQLGSHSPELFDVVLSVAGYGVGTFEPSDEYWGAPQPESSRIFKQFLARQISRLATVPAVVIIHAPTDQVSSFCDTKHIVNTIKAHGGSVWWFCGACACA